MKKYEKPEIIKNEFVADETVAACGDVAISYEEQQVNCIIDGSTTIFTEDVCGDNQVSRGQIVEYGGTTYYLWYDGKMSGKPDDTKDALIKGILSAAGINESGWHAATFDSITTTVSAS